MSGKRPLGRVRGVCATFEINFFLHGCCATELLDCSVQFPIDLLACQTWSPKRLIVGPTDLFELSLIDFILILIPS